jgi:hypothetical protein
MQWILTSTTNGSCFICGGVNSFPAASSEDEKALKKDSLLARHVLLVVFAVLVIIISRLLLDQLQGYTRGAESLEKGNYRGAIMHFDRVLNAHIPFSPLERKAKAHLLGLAARFEQENKYELALLCYETVRTSKYLTRHFCIPDSKDIPFLNDRIATIKSQLLVKDSMVKDFKEGYTQQMGILNKDFSPSVFWSLAAIVAFCGYVGGIVLWIFIRGKVYVIASSLSFVAWFVALYKA